MTTDSYIVIDLETTGIDPQEDRIIEIGYIIKEDGSDRQGSMLIQQEQPIPPFITDLTGITDEMVAKDGISIAEALGYMWACIFYHRQTFPIVGHNILAFDWPFIAAEVARASAAESGKYRQQIGDCFAKDVHPENIIDTAVLYLGWRMHTKQAEKETHAGYAQRLMLHRPRTLKYNLAQACLDMGVDTLGVERHRALGDATLTQRLYEALKNIEIDSPRAVRL